MAHTATCTDTNTHTIQNDECVCSVSLSLGLDPCFLSSLCLTLISAVLASVLPPVCPLWLNSLMRSCECVHVCQYEAAARLVQFAAQSIHLHHWQCCRLIIRGWLERMASYRYGRRLVKVRDRTDPLCLSCQQWGHHHRLRPNLCYTTNKWICRTKRDHAKAVSSVFQLNLKIFKPLAAIKKDGVHILKRLVQDANIIIDVRYSLLIALTFANKTLQLLLGQNDSSWSRIILTQGQQKCSILIQYRQLGDKEMEICQGSRFSDSFTLIQF